MIFSWGNFCSEPLASAPSPLMILKCNWKFKSHGAGNLSPTHPSGQPSLSCPWSSPCSAVAFTAQCITESFFSLLIFPLSLWLAFSFLYNAWQKKNIIPPSALSIFQPFPFLCLPSLKLWILHYFFFNLCASWIIRSWFTTYLLQSDGEVFLQFTCFLFFTVDLLWPSQLVWIQTSNCFLMLMHSLN